MASKTKNFFESGNSAQFEWVLGLYDQVLRLKAEAKSSKPDNVIKLDKWYQNELPKKVKSRGKDIHLTHDEMVQTIKWKLARGKFRPNLVNLVQMNTPRVVMQDTKKAFRKLSKTNDVQAAANILCNMKGVSPGMASAVLAAGAPQLAPFMADECLLAMPDVDTIEYTMKEYMSFVEHINACVARLNQQGGTWNPHKVELAVWTHYVANDLKPELLEDIPSAKATAAAAVQPPPPHTPADTEAVESSTPSPTTEGASDSGGGGGDGGGGQVSEAKEEEDKKWQMPDDAKVTAAEESQPSQSAVAESQPTSSPPSLSQSTVANGQEGNEIVKEGSNGHDSATAPVSPPAHAPPPLPINGTNGNGKHDHSEEDSCDDVEAAKSVSNGSSKKQENGTTKLSESVSAFTDEGKCQKAAEEASTDSNTTNNSSVKRPAEGDTDLATSQQTPPSKKIRTEDNPPPSSHQEQQQPPESATVA